MFMQLKSDLAFLVIFDPTLQLIHTALDCGAWDLGINMS